MKDSKVKWLGNIPEKWEVTNLKKVSDIKTGNTPSGKQEDKYSEFSGIDWIKTNNLLGTKGISKSKQKITSNFLKKAVKASPHSILVCCIGDIGKIGFNTNPVTYNQQINAVKFNNKLFYWKFGFYSLFVQKEQHKAFSNGNVLRILNTENQKRIKVTMPNIEEQKKIANFLDKKTTQIDKLIEKAKLSINEMKAYKQSLITETVTRGLDSNLSMKNSGVEWIGKIPQGWELIKLKYLVDLDPKFTKNKLTPETATFLPMDHLKNGYFINGNNQLTKKNSKKYNYFAENDIAIAKVRPSFENGNIALMENLETGIGFGTSEIFVLRVSSEKLYNEYLLYYLMNTNFINKTSSTMTGVAGLKRYSSNYLRNYKIPLPSLEEQKKIAAFLNGKVSEVDKLITNKKQMVKELDSYKQSLIYEYVTGKKEVK